MIHEHLFSEMAGRKSPTFREGQIGGWKAIFTPEQIARFNEEWGDLQKRLGYGLD